MPTPGPTTRSAAASGSRWGDRGAGPHGGRPGGVGPLRLGGAGGGLPARPAHLGRDPGRRARHGTGGGRRAARAVRPHNGRFDPRAASLAAAVAFGLLLSGTSWPLLGAVAAWLALAALVSRGDGSVVPTGLVFCACSAGGAFLFTLVGGLGLDTAARRAIRAGLLVLVATWLRAAAGSGGLREVGRRALGKVRRLPAMPEASQALEGIASEGRLAAAARSLAASLRDTPTRPRRWWTPCWGGWCGRRAPRRSRRPRARSGGCG